MYVAYDSNGNASVHSGLGDQITVGCFLRADDQECLVLGHMLARMHVLGHVLDRMHVLGHVLDCVNALTQCTNASVNALMPNALMLLVNALMPNALMLLDKQHKNAANRNLIVHALFTECISYFYLHSTVQIFRGSEMRVSGSEFWICEASTSTS